MVTLRLDQRGIRVVRMSDEALAEGVERLHIDDVEVPAFNAARTDLRATLDGARLSLQIDIGFGDAVTPAAQPFIYPTPMPDVPAPTLRPYPKATVIAEKLHAVTALGMTNTRMKDLFDLWELLHDTMLDDAEVQRAVEATFARRQTAMPSARPIGLSDVFADHATKQSPARSLPSSVRCRTDASWRLS